MIIERQDTGAPGNPFGSNESNGVPSVFDYMF